jgi:hypothetical protein
MHPWHPTSKEVTKHMSDHTTTTRVQRARTYALIGALMLAFLLAALLSLQDHLDILQGVEGTDSAAEANSLGKFNQAISTLQGPANVAVGAVGGLGVAAGAALVAVGSPKGLKTVGASAGAIAALLLGNGVIK